MEMTIPLYVLAVALPMFVLTRLSKRVFFQLHSKCKVGSFRRIYCSFPVSVKQNTPIRPNTCFASEPYSLPMVSLEILQLGWFHECIYTRRNNKVGCTVYMRKLVPAPVSYRDDFLILYHVYMMMGHFMSRLFVGTLHVDKKKRAIKNRKDCACATRSSRPADRFHTETGGRFVFTWYRYEISYRCEILALVQQPGWTHAGVTRAGMTLCIM